MIDASRKSWFQKHIKQTININQHSPRALGKHRIWHLPHSPLWRPAGGWKADLDIRDVDAKHPWGTQQTGDMNWLVVCLPPEKIWKSDWIIIPTLGENKTCSKTTSQVNDETWQIDTGSRFEENKLPDFGESTLDSDWTYTLFWASSLKLLANAIVRSLIKECKESVKIEDRGHHIIFGSLLAPQPPRKVTRLHFYTILPRKLVQKVAPKK